MFSYTLVRSRRRTAEIRITTDANIEVRAPLGMSEADINKFVSSKEKWIISHLEKREKLNHEKAAFRLYYGKNALLCGKEYPIRAKYGNLTGFDGEQFYLPPGLMPEDIRHAIIQIYKAAAKHVLKDRTDKYAQKMNLKPASIKINAAKTRWGSCSGGSNLNFSWRLVMADEDVIDYVVVHELAHIREPNHSSRFWTIVDEILPDVKRRKMKLKTLQERLECENW